jgi:mRNA-degrading endonuclease HigB of HigAB toxin-antitoxin module
MFQPKAVEKIKTHFAFNNFFFLENRAVYEIGCKNTVKPGRPQMTVWCMRITCWIPKATNTHSKYVILIVFPLQQ